MLAAGMAAFSPALADNTTPVFEWGNLLTGRPGQDQTRGIAAYGSDAIYWMATDGSVSGDTDVTYAGRFLYDGSEYEGTSANKNLTLLKTNAAGEEQWVIHSTSGDFISGEGNVAVTPEGNVVFFGTVRHTDGRLAEGISLVDAKGNRHELGWDVNDRRNIRLFLATATSEGEILWAKTYEVATTPAAAASGSNADFTADAVNAYALALDNDGNIYVGGRYRNPLTFPAANGANVTLTPKNVSEWTGDSQKSSGDLYVVKLNSDGEYLANLKETGDEVEITYTWDLAVSNGAVYMTGYAKGNGEASFTLGSTQLTPNEYYSPIVAKLDTDLNPEWVKLLPGDAVAGKNALQNIGMTVSNTSVWLAGQYNGRISDADDSAKYVESTQGNLREGFIIKLDAADGEWLAATNSRTDFDQNYLTGYLKVVDEDQTGSDNIFVYGYSMNAGVGAFVRSYNATTLAADLDNSWNLVTQGGVPTAQDLVYVPATSRAYLTVRGNKAFQPFGGEESETVSGYTNYLACFELPKGESTDVTDIITDDEKAVYYDLQGRAIASPTLPGIYIRRQGSESTKILVK